MQSDDNSNDNGNNNGSDNDQAAPEYTWEREDVLTALDPELQRIVLDVRGGKSPPSYLVEELKAGDKTTAVVDVVAMLKRPDAEVPGLRVVQKIGQVVTGFVDATLIEEVRRNDNVISLKAARRVCKMLSNSVSEINATPEQLRDALPPGGVDGAGVIVGFVDHDCDFAHPNFRHRDGAVGTTRLLYLWDQRDGEGGEPPEGYNYGREFDAEAINAALRDANPADGPAGPHRLLGYEIEAGGHGTKVMDPAVGSGSEQNSPGVAPGADIIFVHAVEDDTDSDGSIGNSRHLLEAVKYIFDKADELSRTQGREIPVVINLSLNADGGPHDGSTPVERGFDYLLETPGRAVVIAAGNSRKGFIHLKKTVHPGLTCTLDWGAIDDEPPPEGSPDDAEAVSKLELWYDGRRALEARLRSPGGHLLGPFPPDATFTIYRERQPVGRVFNRVNDPTNGDNQIVILFNIGTDETAEPGLWEVELDTVGDAYQSPFDVHGWAEGDTTPPFPKAGLTDDSYTIGAISCGHSTIVVGGYDTLSHDIIDGSGEGPTRDGRLKPEVSAPSAGVLVANALTDGVVASQGGTSIAAPHVAGVVALLMQAALKEAGKLLTIDQTRELIINTARHEFAHRDPPFSPAPKARPNKNAWDSMYGAGRVDAAAAVASVGTVVGAVVNTLASVEQEELVVSAVTVMAAGDQVPAHFDPAKGGGASAVVMSAEAVSVLTLSQSGGVGPADSAAGVSSGAATGETVHMPPQSNGH